MIPGAGIGCYTNDDSPEILRVNGNRKDTSSLCLRLRKKSQTGVGRDNHYTDNTKEKQIWTIY